MTANAGTAHSGLAQTSSQQKPRHSNPTRSCTRINFVSTKGGSHRLGEAAHEDLIAKNFILLLLLVF